MSEWKNIRTKLRKQYLYGASKPWIACWKFKLFKMDTYDIYKFLLHLRRYEYLIKKKGTPFIKVGRIWNLRRYNHFARKCGFIIGDGVLGEGVTFHHSGNIMINPNARVGAGCKFHGSCCIGVSRDDDKRCPVIGKNVDIGYGAVLLGNIKIADDVVIGANAVVTRSFEEPGSIIAGAPARKIGERPKA